MEKTKILVSANIGLGGSIIKSDDYVKNTTANNRSETYARLHNRLTEVYNSYGQQADIMSIQELGYLRFAPKPFFDAPVASDLPVLVNHQNKARGVGIYSRNEEAIPITTGNLQDEIAAIIDSYTDSKNRKCQFAVINVYRNTHKEFSRSVNQTIAEVNEIIKIITNTYNVRKIVITGDFNTESDMRFMRGFREIKDARNFHQHNSSSKKTFIDRVYANFEDIGFLEVLISVEKVSDARLGHKTAVLYIGRKPYKIKENETKAYLARNIRKQIKFTPYFSQDLLEQIELADSKWRKIKILDEICLEFTNTIKNYLEKSATYIKSKSNVEHVLISQIDNAEDQKGCGKKARKSFLQIWSRLKKWVKKLE